MRIIPDVSKVATKSGMRLSADERRREVLSAATAAFAINGYAGTSTEDIARRAGISQPYLFRLFATKKELFIATAQLMYERIEDAFRKAAEGRTGAEAMVAMANAYRVLLEQRDLLLVQLHAFAASSDPEIGAASRDGFYRIWQLTEELTGFSQDDVRAFFAQGMLMNVIAAIDPGALSQDWASACELPADEFMARLKNR